MERLIVGDKVIVQGIKGVIILNPKFQRNIQISFGSNYGAWMVPRKAVRKINNG